MHAFSADRKDGADVGAEPSHNVQLLSRMYCPVARSSKNAFQLVEQPVWVKRRLSDTFVCLNRTTSSAMSRGPTTRSLQTLTTANLALNKVAGVLAYITRELMSQGLQV